MVSSKPRKQRKDLYNATIRVRQSRMGAHLHPELRAKYGVRTVVVRKGDLVKVMRGGSAGHVGKVVKIDTNHHRITVEKMTLTKADGKQVAKWVDPSNVMVVKLDLSDKWRRRRLGKVADADFETSSEAAEGEAEGEDEDEAEEEEDVE